MRRNQYRRFIWGSLLVLGLSAVGAASPSFAQVTDPATQVGIDDGNDGMDWGWIGLLGLAGLLGLKGRDRVDTTRTTTRP